MKTCKMRKLIKLLFTSLVTSSLFLNACCTAQSIKNATSSKHSNKSTNKLANNKFKPLEYKIQRLSDNKTKVDIVMYVSNQKKQKLDTKSINFLNQQDEKISNLKKKVSIIKIDGKSYIKIEFSYIIEVKDITEEDFVWPVPGFKTIASGFNDSKGREHAHGAIDIVGSGIYGAKVVAASSGRVSVANAKGWGGGYGKYVVIDHGNGKSTLYGHMSSVNVKNGDKVLVGQKIGKVGNTGFSTAPHLHFEYRVNGVRTNPAEILDI